MQKIRDYDYVMDKHGNFYIVRGYWHEKGVFGNLVFSPSSSGTRYNKELKRYYNKVIESNHIPCVVNWQDIIKIYKPKEKLIKSKNKLKETVWGKLINFLIDIGIKEQDIGIFGSYLVGFDISKDIDFVIYGLDNMHLLKQNINKLFRTINTEPITEEHINYQINNHGFSYSKNNSFRDLLKNKWSSIQIAEGILSTIRFAYKDNEIPENPFTNKIINEKVLIGKVCEDVDANFSPRIFKIRTDNNDIFTIATYFWIFQSCVRNGMQVEIKGNLRQNNILTLDKFDHWIKVI